MPLYPTQAHRGPGTAPGTAPTTSTRATTTAVRSWRLLRVICSLIEPTASLHAVIPPICCICAPCPPFCHEVWRVGHTWSPLLVRSFLTCSAACSGPYGSAGYCSSQCVDATTGVCVNDNDHGGQAACKLPAACLFLLLRTNAARVCWHAVILTRSGHLLDSQLYTGCAATSHAQATCTCLFAALASRPQMILADVLCLQHQVRAILLGTVEENAAAATATTTRAPANGSVVRSAQPSAACHAL